MSRPRVPFRLRAYVRGSLWVVPLIGAVAGGGLGQAARVLDEHANVPASWQYSEATASAVLSTIVGAMIALTGIVVALGILIIQSATSTLSPRFMRLWYRDRLQKAVLAGFLGTFAFSFSLLRHLGTHDVPNIGVTLAGLAVGIDIVLFLLYLDRFVHRLRPVGIGALMAGEGGAVFDNYDAELEPITRGAIEPTTRRVLAGEPALGIRSVRSGVLQEIDAKRLVALAKNHECLLLLPFAIGDFVPRDAVLFEVFGDPAGLRERRLRELVGLGRERSIEQDPAFALRVLVDIAIRALSPAVNDPTTAVQMLDHIEDLLQRIGASDGLGDREVRDAGGAARVVLPARGWNEYLALGVTEIREYGGTATQVTRRLRAVLEALLTSVRPEHREAVERELGRLDATLARLVTDPDRRRFASCSDRQGIGGPRRPL